jgi:hypothetical protein
MPQWTHPPAAQSGLSLIGYDALVAERSPVKAAGYCSFPAACSRLASPTR